VTKTFKKSNGQTVGGSVFLEGPAAVVFGIHTLWVYLKNENGTLRNDYHCYGFEQEARDRQPGLYLTAICGWPSRSAA